MAKKYWKRFIIYQRVILIFFAISLIFDIINKDFLDTWAPQEIIDYMFWLSLGFYLGFLLCRYEIKRIWENIEKDKQEKKQIEMIYTTNCCPRGLWHTEHQQAAANK